MRFIYIIAEERHTRANAHALFTDYIASLNLFPNGKIDKLQGGLFSTDDTYNDSNGSQKLLLSSDTKTDAKFTPKKNFLIEPTTIIYLPEPGSKIRTDLIDTWVSYGWSNKLEVFEPGKFDKNEAERILNSVMSITPKAQASSINNSLNSDSPAPSGLFGKFKSLFSSDTPSQNASSQQILAGRNNNNNNVGAAYQPVVQQPKHKVIHFFVGEAFSKNLPFAELNQAIAKLYKPAGGTEEIHFHSGHTSENELKNIAKSLNEANYNVNFSGCMGVKKAADLTKFANGKIWTEVSFEPNDKESIKNGVVICRQGNPDNYATNENTYELNPIIGPNMFNHACYAIPPTFLGGFKPVLKMSFAHGFVLIKEATLEVGGTVYVLNDLIARANSKKNGIDTDNPLVFNLGLISKINQASLNSSLDGLNVIAGVSLQRLGAPNQAKVVKQQELPSEHSFFAHRQHTVEDQYNSTNMEMKN